jgi:hypothetical protein
VFRNLPICLARAANLQSEYENLAVEQRRSVSGPAQMIHAVLHDKRDCDDFTEWQQGLTPKEQLEMKMLEDQREWQAKESALNRSVQRWSIGLNFVGLIVGPLLGVLVAWWFSQSQSNQSQQSAASPASAQSNP